MNNYPNNPQILIEEENLNRLYQKLGEKVFKEMRDKDNGTSSQKFFEDLMNSAMEYCVEITDKIKLIESYKTAPDSVDGIKNDVLSAASGKKCENCGNVCEEDSIFCGSCGSAFAVSGTNAMSAGDTLLFCTECGTELDADSFFCANCGHKVE